VKPPIRQPARRTPERKKTLAHDVHIIAQMNLNTVSRDSDVLADALCVNIETAVFFPVDSVEKGGNGHFKQKTNPAWAAAMIICESCRVRVFCLADAIANPRLTSTGVWGGRDPDERDEISRQSRATMLS